MNNTFYHWGSIIVPPGYADPIQFQAGNPYGTSHTSNNGDPPARSSWPRWSSRPARVVDTDATFKRGREAGSRDAGRLGLLGSTACVGMRGVRPARARRSTACASGGRVRHR